MTDFTDPADDDPTAAGPGPDDPYTDDAVVSAYLDGEAAPEEIERVESDRTLTARLDTFAELTRAVRDVPPPPAELVDRQVAAALSELDPATDPAEPAGTDDRTTSVTSLADRPRRRWSQRLPLAAVAAAVLLLVAVVGVAGLASRGDDAADTAATSLDAGSAGDEQRSEVADDLGATTTGPDVATGGLAAPEAAAAPRLSFSSPDALADYLRDQLTFDSTGDGVGEDQGDDSAGAPDTSASPPSTDAIDPCDAVRLLDLDPASVITVVPASIDGQPVTAVVYDDGSRRLVVVDDATCEVTAAQPL